MMTMMMMMIMMMIMMMLTMLTMMMPLMPMMVMATIIFQSYTTVFMGLGRHNLLTLAWGYGLN